MDASRLVEIKQAANNCLDGMTYNRTKLAQDTIELCDLTERLQRALRIEQDRYLQSQADRNHNSRNDFSEIFGDIFSKKV